MDSDPLLEFINIDVADIGICNFLLVSMQRLSLKLVLHLVLVLFSMRNFSCFLPFVFFCGRSRWSCTQFHISYKHNAVSITNQENTNVSHNSIDDVQLGNISLIKPYFYFQMSLVIFWRDFGQLRPRGLDFTSRHVA